MRRIKNAVQMVVIIGSAVLIMMYPQQTALGISSGIELCLGGVVPSLFPMMLLSVAAVECGYAGKIGKWLAPVSRRLFGLPGEAGTAVLLSLVGGYPAGAKAVTGLYERGAVSREHAARMALFCFCAGPAFLIGMISGLTGSAAHGWLLLAVQTVAVLITGMLFGRQGRGSQQERAADSGMNHAEQVDIVGAIVLSVGKTADAMLQVCLYVVIFSALGELLDAVGISAAAVSLLTSLGMRTTAAEAVLPIIMEVTGGCVRAVKAGLPMMAFAVGFGGLSVQMQVLAITEKLGVRRGMFMLARLFQGTLSALLTAAAVELLPENKAITASADGYVTRLSASPQGAVMLLVMCAVFVLCLPEDNTVTGRRGGLPGGERT